MGEVGGNGLGDEVEDAGVLLAAGFDCGEHRLHEAAPGRALRAKGNFSAKSLHDATRARWR